MLSATLTIKNETGLHTRPGTRFVKLAKTFASNITLKKGERAFNAKSLLTLMKIGISQGDSVELICEGTDEGVALDSLKKFITMLEE
jgi:phosphotransferase system HPr (HPr) family protein